MTEAGEDHLRHIPDGLLQPNGLSTDELLLDADGRRLTLSPKKKGTHFSSPRWREEVEGVVVPVLVLPRLVQVERGP